MREGAQVQAPCAKSERNARPEPRKKAPARHEGSRRGELMMLTQKDSEIGTIAAIGPLGDPPASKYERLVARAKQVSAATTIVVHPCDETSLRGPIEAAQAGIIVPILVGPAAKIAAVAR